MADESARPVVIDLSLRLGKANQKWADLKERLETAERKLMEMAAEDESLHFKRRDHLRSKAEGLRTALSYLEEYDRG